MVQKKSMALTSMTKYRTDTKAITVPNPTPRHRNAFISTSTTSMNATLPYKQQSSEQASDHRINQPTFNMALSNRIFLLISLCLTLSASLAFAPTTHHSTTLHRSSSTTLKLTPTPTTTTLPLLESSTINLSVATLDPTTVLSDALGGLLGSSAILAVPIVAALTVAGAIAFFIVSYANPEDED